MKGLIPELQDWRRRVYVWWSRVDIVRLLERIGFVAAVIGLMVCCVGLAWDAGQWLAGGVIAALVATWLEDRL